MRIPSLPQTTGPAASSDDWPDLVLFAWASDKHKTLYFELHNQLEHSLSRYKKLLKLPPSTPLKDLQSRLARSGDSAPGIGAKMAEHLLPESLRKRLLAIASKDSARVLWIVSDDLPISWELLRLADHENRGPFLAEAFHVSRWFFDLPQHLSAPVKNLALVAAKDSRLKLIPERQEVESRFEASGRKAVQVEASLPQVVAAFASNMFDGWHFVGHSARLTDSAELAGMVINRDETFTAADLKNPGCNLRESRPLVLLNCCSSAAGHASLTGLGGFAQSFVEAGAAAVIGTNWPIETKAAKEFASAFYESFLAGATIASAVSRGREAARKIPDDSSWLAYTLLAHPSASVARPAEELPPFRQNGAYLKLPFHVWKADFSPPGTLLRADHGIVPFHGREKELTDLHTWCSGERPIEVRLYTGPGGMGKTRLALEACRRFRLAGWRTGFVTSAADQARTAAIQELAQGTGPLLAVVDYAETRRDLLVPLLRELIESSDGEKVRIILLARWREDWWEQLKREGDNVGDLLSGPATRHFALEPLASTREKREETYQIAVRSFAEVLDKPTPGELPDNLEAEHFKPVLMIHMSALGAVEGAPMKDEDGILDWVLNREKRFWDKQAEARRLGSELIPGIARAMCAITLAGGTVSKKGTITLLEALKVFRGQAPAVLDSIERLLHQTYPGDRWVMPLQPDILGEHLAERVLADDPQEIFDLVLGPRSDAAMTGDRGDAG